MLHGLLLNRLLIAAVGVAAIAVAAPRAGTARADDAQVTVVSPGGEQRPLSLGALVGGEDVVEHAYELHSSTGDGTQVVNGFSLGAILDAAGADPFGFSYLEVQRPAGGSVLLSRHQALDPGAFADGGPVVYATAAGTGFLRPSSGAYDLNASDSFEAPQGITIVLRKGSPLRVRAAASTLRTRPGRPVHFNAIVDRAGSGESLSYSWYFDDGHSAAGAQASHSFRKRGSYDVVVGITTAGDEAGASALVTIQVGAPLTGPDRRGGGRDHGAAAPDHGAANGPSSGASSGRQTGTAPPTRDPSAAPAQPAQESRSRADTPTPTGRHVSGLLLSKETAVKPPPAPKPQAAARTGSLSGKGGGGLPTAAWGLLATAGLLGLGALVEARSLLG